MRLSQVFASYVSSRSRSRGESYFRSGAVERLISHGGAIEATVMGSDAYSVLLQPSDDAVCGSCTCPHFADHFEICKHIWATILAAEAKGILLVPPGRAPAAIGLEPFDPDSDPYDADADLPEFDEDEDDGDGWLPEVREPMRRLSAAERRRVSERMRKYWAERRRDQTNAPEQAPPYDVRARLSSPPQRKPPARSAPPPPWQRLLTSITSPSHTPTPPQFASGQLLYVIDVPSSLNGGALVLELMTRDRRMNGEWGKPRPARVRTSDVHAHPDPTERQILERLLGARTHLPYAYSDYGQELTRQQVHGVLVTDIIPLLCATGRCVLRTSAPGVPASHTAFSAPVEWDDGPPWTFGLGITASDNS